MIRLRKFQDLDAELLITYLNNDDVTKFVTNAIPQPYSKSDAQRWIDHSKNSEYIRAIEHNGVFIGCISAKRGEFEYSCSAELGYWVGKRYWNKGLATMAVEDFTNLIFQSTNIIRLFVSVVSENSASIKVLEKNNFTLEGILKKASYKNHQYYDEHLYSKIRTSCSSGSQN
ncbi:GNAT family N-acetyltransferase [Agaribacterium sp. ZY112]|uniref:GNAT family N-acetyltransferase n=1 Tax=Agaribacterium sp. ZY112 TaxID=3233574 RepID=UPI003526BE08